MGNVLSNKKIRYRQYSIFETLELRTEVATSAYKPVAIYSLTLCLSPF